MLITDIALITANFTMFQKIANVLSIVSFLMVASMSGGAYFGYKYVTSENFKSRVMNEILGNVQGMMPKVLEKTKSLKSLIEKKKHNVDIEIDGGINFDNCTLAKKAGANILVSGSTIFKENKGDLKKNIEILRKN